MLQHEVIPTGVQEGISRAFVVRAHRDHMQMDTLAGCIFVSHVHKVLGARLVASHKNRWHFLCALSSVIAFMRDLKALGKSHDFRRFLQFLFATHVT